MVRVVAVRPLEGFVLDLAFSDGTSKRLDVTPYLRGPIFDPLRRELALFRAVTVDPALGTIVWPNGADICPDVLREGRVPAAWDEHAA